MSDAASAIYNGAAAVFPDIKRAMCWAHVVPKVKAKLSLLSGGDEVKRLMMCDIYILQLATDEEEFIAMTSLFKSKWRTEGSRTFMEYFTATWLDSNANWYEGFTGKQGSTNNGLEGTNRWIKEHFTARKKMPLNEFLLMWFDMVQTWSIDHKERKPWSSYTEWEKNLELQTRTYHWSQGVDLVLDLFDLGQTEGIQYLLIKSSSCKEDITEAMVWDYVNLYDRQIPTNSLGQQPKKMVNLRYFDLYCEIKSMFWLVTYDSVRKLTDCNCPVFLKEYVCKHSLGILFIKKDIYLDARVKAVPLGQKRGPGRPKNAGLALSFE